MAGEGVFEDLNLEECRLKSSTCTSHPYAHSPLDLDHTACYDCPEKKRENCRMQGLNGLHQVFSAPSQITKHFPSTLSELRRTDKDFNQAIPLYPGLEYDDSLSETEGNTAQGKDDHLDNKGQKASQEQSNGRKCFTYETPLPEETGAWIPVSVPPSDHEGFELDFFPEDTGWNGYDLSAWRILIEVIAFLCGAHMHKAKSKQYIRDMRHDGHAVLPYHDYDDDTFDPLASSLTDQMEDHVRTMSAVLASEPPQWLPDSSASVCMQCGAWFHPFICSRHHCRFCGRIFCGSCTGQRSLVPVSFREKSPQRVCDSCYERLAPVQGLLFERVSNAAQPATHDVTDLTCLRAWINSPLGFTLEHEIYKATNTLRGFMEVGNLKPERAIPDIILKGAKGLAIFTVLKVGMMVTYKVGTGLVVAKKSDGSWSPPSAIISSGIGWGAQAGGEITDFVVVLRSEAAVKAFAGSAHISFGAGVSIAVGPLGRSLEADVRAGDGGAAACYMYSLSKGVFVGCSLEGDVVMTRSGTNVQFYGDPSISAAEILMGSVKQPMAAAPLYAALSDLFSKVQLGCNW